MNPECQQLLALLADHEWHFVDEVFGQLVTRVAPGRAIRRYELNAASREAKEGPRVTPPLSEPEMILSGARALANHALTSMRKRYIEMDEKGDARLCRLRDKPLPVRTRASTPRTARNVSKLDPESREALLAERRAAETPQTDEQGSVVPEPTPEDPEPLACATCGLYVVNPDQHAIWHKEVEAAKWPSLTFCDAGALREVIRGVLREELTTVVKENRRQLIMRFAALEDLLGVRLRPRNLKPRSAPKPAVGPV